MLNPRYILWEAMRKCLKLELGAPRPFLSVLLDSRSITTAIPEALLQRINQDVRGIPFAQFTRRESNGRHYHGGKKEEDIRSQNYSMKPMVETPWGSVCFAVPFVVSLGPRDLITVGELTLRGAPAIDDEKQLREEVRHVTRGSGCPLRERPIFPPPTRVHTPRWQCKASEALATGLGHQDVRDNDTKELLPLDPQMLLEQGEGIAARRNASTRCDQDCHRQRCAEGVRVRADRAGEGGCRGHAEGTSPGSSSAGDPGKSCRIKGLVARLRANYITKAGHRDVGGTLARKKTKCVE